MHFDVCIFDSLQKEADSPTPGSRRGMRLLDGAERLRKLLSQIREASATIENITDMGDKTFKFSRNQLIEVGDALLRRLEALVAQALEAAGVDASAIQGVELVGGGSRMPVVQEAAITKFFGGDIPLHAKLDDSSTSIGAALLSVERAAGAALEAPVLDAGVRGLSEEALAAAVAAEQAMQDQDRRAWELLDARNALEAMVFKWRDAPSQKHGELIDASTLGPALDKAEMWLWDNLEATLEEVLAFSETLKNTVDAASKDFVAAQVADEKSLNAELEKSAREAEAERQANGEEDDHDTRKLPKKERMRMVLKNKEEGTELFKGGNWRMAGARYSKALTHAAKFFDLSPEDEQEVKDVKLSLYLNLSMCYIKMSNWDQVMRNTGEALTLDPNNAKALFRRASAFEAKKDWDKALEDLKAAAAANPADKGIPKAQERVKKMVEKEKAKEKKMWGNVFGK